MYFTQEATKALFPNIQLNEIKTWSKLAQAAKLASLEVSQYYSFFVRSVVYSAFASIDSVFFLFFCFVYRVFAS